MKKFIILTACVFLAFSSAAFAETFDQDGPSTATGSTVLDAFKTSKNVTIGVLGNTLTYAAVSGHSQGNRQFGSASGDSKLYAMDVDLGTEVAAPDESDSSVFAGSGWTAL